LEISKPIPLAFLISIKILNNTHPVPVPISKKLKLLF